MGINEPVDPKFLELLARHLSHQLNNPIASIGSAAYLIEDILTPESPKSEAIQSAMPFVGSIREDATQLKELVDEFRKFFTSENFLPSRVNLLEFLQTRVTRAKQTGLEVILEVPDGVNPLEAQLDLGLMQSAFELLFKELVARQAPSVHISSSVKDDMNFIELRVPANLGLEAESAANFFEPIPFAAGRGLGLTLPYIRKLIEVHSGSVRSYLDASGHFMVEIFLPRAK